MKRIKLFGCILLIFVALATFSSCDGELPPTHPSETEEETNQSCEHLFDAFNIIIEPTESVMGQAESECTKCGQKYSVYLPKLSNQNYALTVIEGTCTEQGERIYSSKYGVFTVKTPAKGHNFIHTTKPATCTTKGKEIYTCSVCGKVEETPIEKLAHSYEQTDAYEGSCIEEGFIEYTCSECHKTIKINKGYNHRYDEGVYRAVECPQKGFYTYTCTQCGDKKIIYDEKAGHSFNKDTGACENCGEKCHHIFEDYICSVCHLNIEERVKADGFFHVDSDCDGEMEIGEEVYFGTYPKSIVGDKELLSQLIEVTPINGIYTLEGVEYIKKDLNQRNSALVKFSDGNIANSKIFVTYGYYYRIEPILWVIKEINSDNILLRAKNIIDVQDYLGKSQYQFSTDETTFLTINEENYACAWESSKMRSFLNDDFRAIAFDSVQKGMLMKTEIDNSVNSAYYKNRSYAVDDNTQDFVFIESFGELFGEDESFDTASEQRMASVTDYVIGSGIDLREGYASNIGKYYTRSAGSDSSKIGLIDEEGQFDMNGALHAETEEDTGKTLYGIGVLPCVWLKISE